MTGVSAQNHAVVERVQESVNLVFGMIRKQKQSPAILFADTGIHISSNVCAQIGDTGIAVKVRLIAS